MAQLGDRVRDRITGFEGIVISTIYYLTGCSQHGVKPTTLKDGIPQDAVYLDVHRVEVVKGGKIKMGEVTNTKDPGGPQESPKGD